MIFDHHVATFVGEGRSSLYCVDWSDLMICLRMFGHSPFALFHCIFNMPYVMSHLVQMQFKYDANLLIPCMCLSWYIMNHYECGNIVYGDDYLAYMTIILSMWCMATCNKWSICQLFRSFIVGCYCINIQQYSGISSQGFPTVSTQHVRSHTKRLMAAAAEMMGDIIYTNT